MELYILGFKIKIPLKIKSQVIEKNQTFLQILDPICWIRDVKVGWGRMRQMTFLFLGQGTYDNRVISFAFPISMENKIITTSLPLKCGLEQQKDHLPKRRKRLGTS